MLRRSFASPAFLVLFCAFAAVSMGTEELGNKPVANNEEWAAGVLAVANDPHRTYTRWVNHPASVDPHSHHVLDGCCRL